jgi:hypothetical protein
MSIKTLLLVGALSLGATSVAYADDAPGNRGNNNGRSHASAAPACGDRCPLLATDGPGTIGDNNGRSMASATAIIGQVPALWLLLASEEGLGSGGDQSGRGATGGRGGISGEV